MFKYWSLLIDGLHTNIDLFLVSILKFPRQLWNAWSQHCIRLCISLLFPLCRAVRCDWPPFFSVCTGGWRQVLSAAECCSVCGLQRPSPTFQQYFDGHRYSRERRRILSASTLQQKSWEGEWEPAVIYLQWEDLDIKLCISFLLLSCNGSLNTTPLPDFKQRFSPLIAQLPNWSHWHKRFLFSFTSCMKKIRSVDVCVHETQSERMLL